MSRRRCRPPAAMSAVRWPRCSACGRRRAGTPVRRSTCSSGRAGSPARRERRSTTGRSRSSPGPRKRSRARSRAAATTVRNPLRDRRVLLLPAPRRRGARVGDRRGPGEGAGRHRGVRGGPARARRRGRGVAAGGGCDGEPGGGCGLHAVPHRDGARGAGRRRGVRGRRVRRVVHPGRGLPGAQRCADLLLRLRGRRIRRAGVHHLTTLPGGAWAFDELEGEEEIEVEGADAARTGVDELRRPVLDLRVGADWLRLTTFDGSGIDDLAPIAATIADDFAVARPGGQ